MGKHQTPAEAMCVAVKKVDFNPVMREIEAHPFIWVCALAVLLFALGNLFEILWMMLRDFRLFVFRIFRYPRRFVKHRIVDPVKKSFLKRYGKKKRESRSLWKR